MTATQPTTTVTLTIDGKSITVPKGTTVYHACRTLGIDIPIFCYQDRMPPFGACRVCLVQVEKMAKLQTSCTLECAEGMVVTTQSQMAVDGRKGILEFLLINHPLDCPICDRGGECPLQEQALKFGPGESRFFEDKRHFVKAISLGPVLKLDRERCIQCARCTRFGDLLAGDHALEFIDRGFKMEVGTPGGGPADSKFIGNTIMICPVGALTSSVYRFRARPWDNLPTDSTCTLCPVGCSLILDSRDGQIMRTRSREDKNVNDIWMCDKGWFGYEYTSNPDRLHQPLARINGKLSAVSWNEAFFWMKEKWQQAKATGKIAGWGGNPLTTEENYLFQKLIREAGGVNNVDHRIGMPIVTEEGVDAGMQMEIKDLETVQTVILLGLDLTEDFPVLWLRLRQAINRGANVYFAGHYAPEIARYLKEVVLHAPGKELEHIQSLLPKWGQDAAILVGSQYLNSINRSAILGEILKYPASSLNVMEGRNNSVGARFAGMYPNNGLNALQVLDKAASEGWDFLYVAGANPAMKYPKAKWEAARKKIGFLVVQDIFMNETAVDADLVLPTLTYVEKGGSFINIEGRVQTLLPGKEIPQGIYSDGDIFMHFAQELNVPLSVDAEFAVNLMPGRLPLKRDFFTPAPYQALPEGLKATFAHALFDNGVRIQHDPHVSKLVKDPFVRIHPSEGEKRGIKGGSHIRLTINGASILAPVQLCSQTAEGTVVIPLGFNAIAVQELGQNLLNGQRVDIEHVG